MSTAGPSENRSGHNRTTMTMNMRGDDNLKRPFRVTEAHPWTAWHGDTVFVVGDPVDGECTFEGPPLLPEWAWLTWLTEGALELPCIWHRSHVRVRGPWSGVIPADGLEPLVP